MITRALALLTSAEYQEHQKSISEELLRQAAEDMRAHGWDRDDFDRFLRELLEE